jgi:predicted small integral membrane protein
MSVTERPATRLLALGTLPVAAAVLTAINALYLLLVVFGNITDFATNQQYVQHVLAMDTTFHDKHLMWRAITSRTLQNIAYVAIIVWEAASALLLTLATAWWFPALRRGHGYAQARRAATLGLLMMLWLFGAGFIAIGGEWFAMWQSKAWNGLDAAIRNVTLAGLALLLVQLPSRQWDID